MKKIKHKYFNIKQQAAMMAVAFSVPGLLIQYPRNLIFVTWHIILQLWLTIDTDGGIPGRKFTLFGSILSFYQLFFPFIILSPIVVVLGIKGFLDGDKIRSFVAICLGIFFQIVGWWIYTYVFPII